jgi:hypothetical protein
MFIGKLRLVYAIYLDIEAIRHAEHFPDLVANTGMIKYYGQNISVFGQKT